MFLKGMFEDLKSKKTQEMELIKLGNQWMFEPLNRSFIVQLEDKDASRSALDAKKTEGAIETRVCMGVYILYIRTQI